MFTRVSIVLTGMSVLFCMFSGIYGAVDRMLGPDELIRRVETVYSDSTTFESDFRQVYTGRNFGKVESSGKVYFKRPGMMRWNYEKPSKKIIVASGSNLWIYDTQDSQVILDREFKKEKMPSSLSFLWGEQKLGKVFKYKILSVEDRKKRGFYTVELLPREKIPNVSKLHFVIDATSYLITETAIFDLFGNENRLYFRDPKIGKKMKDSFFDFKPPKGVTVVEPPHRISR